jgi:hypothetical protein
MKFPFESAACEQAPLPEGLDTNEQAVYLSLRNLYWLLKKGEITRERAKEEKTKIVREYTRRKNIFDYAQTAINVYQKAQSCAMRYAKEPTIENADAFYAAVYGLPLDWRLERKETQNGEK